MKGEDCRGGLVTAAEIEEVVLFHSPHIQIHAQSKSTTSLSQGLNFSWRPSSTSNILPGCSLLFLCHLCISFHTHCTKTLPLPFSRRSRLSPHAHHLYTVNMMRHAINVYIHIQHWNVLKSAFTIRRELDLDLSLVDFHPVSAQI